MIWVSSFSSLGVRLAFYKLVLMLALILIPHGLAGGRWHYFWQPFDLMIVEGTYLAFYLNMIGLRRPSLVDPTLLWQVGRVALWPAAFVAIACRATHVPALMDGGSEVLANHLSTSGVPLFYSILIFAVTFRPAPVVKLSGKFMKIADTIGLTALTLLVAVPFGMVVFFALQAALIKGGQ